jgi:hypothetical protein
VGGKNQRGEGKVDAVYHISPLKPIYIVLPWVGLDFTGKKLLAEPFCEVYSVMF